MVFATIGIIIYRINYLVGATQRIRKMSKKKECYENIFLHKTTVSLFPFEITFRTIVPSEYLRMTTEVNQSESEF